MFCFISQLSKSHFDGLWHRKETGPTYSWLTIFFEGGVLSVTSQNLVMEFFRILYIQRYPLQIYIHKVVYKNTIYIQHLSLLIQK
jgi:hypothetical protein